MIAVFLAIETVVLALWVFALLSERDSGRNSD